MSDYTVAPCLRLAAIFLAAIVVWPASSGTRLYGQIGGSGPTGWWWCPYCQGNVYGDHDCQSQYYESNQYEQFQSVNDSIVSPAVSGDAWNWRQVQPPSYWDREKELSTIANQRGVDCLKRQDTAQAIRYFQLALQHWAGNVEARSNLQAVHAQTVAALREAERLGRNVELLARQISENTRHHVEQALADLMRAAERRQDEAARRRLQKARIEIDQILRRGTEAFTSSRGQQAAQLDFLPPPATRQRAHHDPSVVDARQPWGDTDEPRRTEARSERIRAVGQPNPRTRALLDALEAGRGVWSISIGYFKARIVDNPHDLAARDAYQFVIGFTEALHVREPRPQDMEIPLMPGDLATEVNPKAQADVWAALDAIGRDDFAGAYDALCRAHRADPRHGGIRDNMNWLEGRLAANDVRTQSLYGGELLAELVDSIQYPMPATEGSEDRQRDSGFFQSVAGFFQKLIQ